MQRRPTLIDLLQSLSVATGILTATSLVFSLGLVMNSTCVVGSLWQRAADPAPQHPAHAAALRSTTLVRLSLFFSADASLVAYS
jgi:hypothetical protein